MTARKRSALVIVGHGSTVNPDSSAPTYMHADAIRKTGLFGEVACCFWKEEPSMREVFRMVESNDIYVVPNFISEGYFTQTVIPRELGLEGPLTRQGSRVIKYCKPAGSHDRMTELLEEAARDVAPGVPSLEASLLIVGHGTALNDNSARAAKEQVRKISAGGRYGEVAASYMEEAPLVSDWDKQTSMPHVIVVPFFISDGLHSYQDIPVLLGIRTETGPAASQSEVFQHNPHSLRGRSLYYAAAIGSGPRFANIILDQVDAFDAEYPL